MPSPAVADRLGTEALRAAVLASWADSPTRFREDANAEEDLLLGGYADRWLVELAQNAADAAQRAGTKGRLLVHVVRDDDGPELRVANTGAPLDADGVAALASLRASSKRDSDAVGRFGVGFAAVLGLSNAPRIVSSTGGVAFSLDRTAAQVRALPGAAADELRRRGGRPPVLRLCWPLDPAEPPMPAGFDTEVRLPLDNGIDPDELCGSADRAAADLLLALPWLAEITVTWPDGRSTRHARVDRQDGMIELRPSGQRWLLVRRHGRVQPSVAGRAVEDRADWSVCWAVPLHADGRPRPLEEDVLHAPTPSDERLTLPARMFANLPMQPTRRRVRVGPATDAVLAESARAYLDLVLAVPADHRLALAPRPGFPRSELDAALREAVTAVLRDDKWLPSAAGPDLAPKDAVLIEQPGLGPLLSDVVPGLVAQSVTEAPRAVWTALGVHTVGLGELADRLAGVARPPSWWHRLYSALAEGVDGRSAARDEMAALPVPLVDGRTVTGPRTTVTLTEAAAWADHLDGLDLPGLRIVHPAAAHPLLHRLGATEAGPAELLDHPSVAEAVAASVTEAEESGADPMPLARLVLGLLAQVGTGRQPLAARPWLAGLALPDADGEPYRADELMLPDAAIEPLLVPDAPVGVLAAEVAEEYPRHLLTSVGVLDTFAVLVDEQPTGPDHELADEELWWADHAEPDPPSVLVAVRDLDLVADQAWPDALAVLAADPACRPALRRANPADPEPYTTWWLAQHARLGGHPPAHWRLAAATALAGLFDPVPSAVAAELDDELLAAIGVRRDATVRDAADAAELLARLGDPDRSPDTALVWAVHAALADAVVAGRLDPADVQPPSVLRSVNGAVLNAERAVLLDRPWLAPALPSDQTVAGRFDDDGVAALAELLDLPLASEVVAGQVADDVLGTGEELAWAALPEVVAACSALGLAVPQGTMWRHQRLIVQLTRPRQRRIEVPVWWQDGRWHAADPVRALVAACAPLTRLRSVIT